MIKKIKKILFEPDIFFSKLKEDGVKKSAIYYLILSLFTTILLVVLSLVAFNQRWNIGLMQYKDVVEISIGMIFVLGVLIYILGFAFSFVGAYLLHLWLKLWGANVEYFKTYQLCAYARTPNFLLGWIPFIGLLASVYRLVLLIMGTERIHKLPHKKAIYAYVIPLILWLLVMIILVSVVYSLYGQI